jgi:hypothetical protein
MKLYPLLPEQFDCLIPLLAERLEECKLSTLSSPEYILGKLKDFYSIRSAGAYVDDTNDPKHCLIMLHFPGVAVDRMLATISLIYTRIGHRGDPANVDVLFTTAENYARLNGADLLNGSSWLFDGSKRTDALWEKRGFTVESINYVKKL